MELSRLLAYVGALMVAAEVVKNLGYLTEVFISLPYSLAVRYLPHPKWGQRSKLRSVGSVTVLVFFLPPMIVAGAAVSMLTLVVTFPAFLCLVVDWTLNDLLRSMSARVRWQFATNGEPITPRRVRIDRRLEHYMTGTVPFVALFGLILLLLGFVLEFF